jgi:hypothetical protein
MTDRYWPLPDSHHVLVVLVMILLFDSGPSVVFGEGLRDFADGWLLNPRDMEFILGPAGTRDLVTEGVNHEPKHGSGWGLWVGAGQGNLFSMKDLPLRSIEGGIIQRAGPLPWSLAFSWEHLGESLMVEETGALRLRLGGNPQVGIRLRGRSWLVTGERVDTSLETGLEGRVSFPMGSLFRGEVAIWIHPGNLPGWHGRAGRRTLAEFKLFPPGWGLALRMDQRGDGVPVLSMDILGRLTPRLGLGFRADPETGSLGGTLVARLGGFWFHTSHLVHPALGVTHRFHLGGGDPDASIW